MSFHGRYVTAMGGGGGWLLRQEQNLSPCGWFTLQHLGNGKVSLMTCPDRYITAPRTWHHETGLGCSGKTLNWATVGSLSCTSQAKALLLKRVRGGSSRPETTAGNRAWNRSVIAETFDKLAWELFTVLRR